MEIALHYFVADGDRRNGKRAGRLEQFRLQLAIAFHVLFGERNAATLQVRAPGAAHVSGGARGVEELAKRVDSGDWAVAFSLFPTSLADLMAVADAGEMMPPKSTWFEPKLADGLVSLVID